MPSVSFPARPVKASRRSPQPAKLVSCGCSDRPIYHCDLLPRGRAGLVDINGEPYALRCHGHQPEDGYRLTKLASGAVYDLDVSSGVPLCDCPDATYRDRQCKHSLALVQLHRDGVI
jgi:hypothetical protein